MTALEHQTRHVQLTSDAWWPVPDGQAFVVLKPDDPAMVIIAHIGGDTSPPLTPSQEFVAPAVMRIGGLAEGRRVWLRASKRPGRVRIDLTAKGATPRPTFGPSPFRRSETGGDTSGIWGAS